MSLGFTYHSPGYYPGFFQLPLTRTVETSYITATVYPSFYKHIVIEYSVPPHWGACLFDVYRAESDVGPWSKITNSPTSSNYVKDETVRDFSKFMSGWYLVECQLPDGRRIQSPPVTWQNTRLRWVELRAKEIERRETILLEKFTGVKTFVFRRKSFGLRCTECWDAQIEKVRKDHCKTCLGTSFTGGYFPGFQTLFQYEPTPNTAVKEARGTVETNTLSAWTISSPKLEMFDIILRVPDWKIFRIEQAVSTELQTVEVRQTVQLIELAKDSIEFQLAQQAMPADYV